MKNITRTAAVVNTGLFERLYYSFMTIWRQGLRRAPVWDILIAGRTSEILSNGGIFMKYTTKKDTVG